MKSEIKGRNLLLTIGCIAILFDLLSTVFSIYTFLEEPSLISYTISQGIFRLLIEIALVIFCYKGNAWAKWILCVILAFSSIILLLQYTSSGNFILLIISIIYLVSGALLLTSPYIKEFMTNQNSK
ncbi:hypothetical protein [Cellulosilyticum lentocellum]|uniref:Uncharacterized protein n=1 Tax=Cellulosilyticum lentocellum (strain ATCC 49066 / DSM 5427 / NCIMB 11756 / RHM5) TaxID=642492 RepID=F2JNN9_CELLD|nr:hypothetical protein [Cellulosilyticum lentocellum]ADZ85928.1 hypothetical protein Clole_4257 [Cellulosilyticum lentocellum DSM 5427]